MLPETRYARTGDTHIAYQVAGDGPLDILLAAEFWHSIEVQWDQPDLASFLERLASFGRLISFDQRGSGVSDPVPLDELTSLDVWLDDIRVVMDTVGSESAVLYGVGGGGTMSMLFAATHPDRVSGLILVNSFARISRAAGLSVGPGSGARGRGPGRHAGRGGAAASFSTRSRRAASVTRNFESGGRATSGSEQAPAPWSRCGRCSVRSTSVTSCRASARRP